MNGIVAHFSIEKQELLNKFWLHKSSISSLAFLQSSENIIASGSADCSIVLYDIVAGSALKKLKGHSNGILSLHFCSLRFLASVGKDSLIKLWDIEEQRCVATSSELQKSITAACYVSSPVDLQVVGFLASNRLKIFRRPDSRKEEYQEAGQIKRKTEGRVTYLGFSYDCLICIDAQNSVEVWKIATQEELARKMLLARRRTKGRDQIEKKVTVKQEKKEVEKAMKVHQYDHGLMFLPLIFAEENQVCHPFSRLTSAQILKTQDRKSLILSTPDNAIRQFLIEEEEVKEVKTLNRLGHSTPVRSIVMSQDDRYIVSASNECTKVWQLESYQAIHTFKTHLASSVSILPGSAHVLCGTRQGELLLYSLSSAELLHIEKQAHSKEIWSLSCHAQASCNPKAVSIVSASADSSLKIWSVTSKSKAIGLVCLETLELTDEATSAQFSPNGKWLVVSLLDNTIKILHCDSKKLFLSLYAHKLPVLCFDISSDDALLVSGSVDKNVKIWGMDFGDVHKSIFAHSEAITAVKFVKGTHYFFSCGKDGVVKYYDADNYDEVMVFEFHFGEVWDVAISSSGLSFATCSSDKSVRLFSQTDQQVFVALERRNREELQSYEDAQKTLEERKNEDLVRFTAQNVKYGEALIDALQKADQFRLQVETYRMQGQGGVRPTIPFEFGRQDVFGYVLSRLEQIRTPDLQSALSYLNFSEAKNLFFYLEHFVRCRRGDVARVLKTILVLSKAHERRIVGTRSLAQIFLSMSSHLKQNILQLKETVDFNLTVLSHLESKFKAESKK